MAERQTSSKIKTIRTDNGLEYINKQFQSYLEKFGIRHQRTNDYTPQQNGMAERAIVERVGTVRCMLFEANMEKSFWAEAVSKAMYLIIRSSTRPKQKRRKWDAKAHECCLVGFDEDTKACRVYDPATKISRSRDVTFSNESDVGTPTPAVKVSKPTVIKLDAEEAASLSQVPKKLPTSIQFPQ